MRDSVSDLELWQSTLSIIFCPALSDKGNGVHNTCTKQNKILATILNIMCSFRFDDTEQPVFSVCQVWIGYAYAHAMSKTD